MPHNRAPSNPRVFPPQAPDGSPVSRFDEKFSTENTAEIWAGGSTGSRASLQTRRGPPGARSRGRRTMVHLLTGKTSVFSTSLSTFTTDEVRRFSVVPVTVPLSVDTMTDAVEGGLYDLRMGPADAHSSDRCETCRLPYAQCPGHFGHLELCLPLYNPLLLKFTVNLLGITCQVLLLKADEKTVAKYAKTLRKLGNQARRDTSSGTRRSTNRRHSLRGRGRRAELLEQFSPSAVGRRRAQGAVPRAQSTLDRNKRILQLSAPRRRRRARRSTCWPGPPRKTPSRPERRRVWSESGRTRSCGRRSRARRARRRRRGEEGEDGRRHGRRQRGQGQGKAERGKKDDEPEKHKFISPKEVKSILDKSVVMENDIFQQLLRATNRYSARKGRDSVINSSFSSWMCLDPSWDKADEQGERPALRPPAGRDLLGHSEQECDAGQAA